MVRRPFAFLVLAVFGGLTVAVASEGAEGSALVTPRLGLIIWTTVTFVLLALLLGRLAWRPLVGAIEARERGIRETIDQARSDREEAQSLLDEHKEILSQTRRERAAAVAQGQQDAERLKAEILEEAKRQREQLLQQTHSRIGAEMRQARAELRGVAADLAIQAAAKLLAKDLDSPAHRKLVEDYLAELERLPADSSALPS